MVGSGRAKGGNGIFYARWIPILPERFEFENLSQVNCNGREGNVTALIPALTGYRKCLIDVQKFHITFVDKTPVLVLIYGLLQGNIHVIIEIPFFIKHSSNRFKIQKRQISPVSSFACQPTTISRKKRKNWESWTEIAVSLVSRTLIGISMFNVQSIGLNWQNSSKLTKLTFVWMQIQENNNWTKRTSGLGVL